jgi:hypothetical protein
VDDTRRGELIQQYRDGYRVITEALEDISNSEMDAREGPQEWSPREVIHHLADSEMTSAIRLRRLLTEERPEIVGYDQEAYARILYYDRLIEPSLEAFRYARASTAQLLERMTDVEWERQGTHSESGSYTVEGWLEIYSVHAHEHADQIRRARATVK